MPSLPLLSRLSLAALTLTLAACAATVAEPEGPPRKELVYGVTADNQLIKFNAGQPGRLLERKFLTGLPAGRKLVGIDYRVARGVLYALADDGRLYILDAATGYLRPVGDAPSAIAISGKSIGFDFNPTADRIRVVSDAGLNLRLHPDTGAAVDGDAARDGLQPDGPLAFVAGDANAGKKPELIAAGYTYNKKDSKITTNYAIDRGLGVLVMQGSREGETPVVSPNTGQLHTVGSLGLPQIVDASFDIADINNAALAALRTTDSDRTRLYLIDLDSGKARPLGTVGDGSPLVGIAIEP